MILHLNIGVGLTGNGVNYSRGRGLSKDLLQWFFIQLHSNEFVDFRINVDAEVAIKLNIVHQRVCVCIKHLLDPLFRDWNIEARLYLLVEDFRELTFGDGEATHNALDIL